MGATGGAAAGAGSAGAASGGAGAASGGAGATSGGAGGAGATGGSPCETAEGVRLCGGNGATCGWIDTDECPGGGCTRPYDRELGGDAIAGVCFSDLPDNGSRACLECEDGEVCIERNPGEHYCVAESVCAKLWNLGARGVCRYADLSAYDARPLPRLTTCPKADPNGYTYMCGGACPTCKSDFPTPCTGRSPDHPQGFCSYSDLDPWCALDDSGYVNACKASARYCGVFHVTQKDAGTAKMYGRCMTEDTCLALSQELPGGFDCYDADAQLVAPSK
jgi:hypothetical protein